MSVVFIDRAGQQCEENLDVNIYRTAENEGMSVRQYINKKYPTRADDKDAFTQMCASAGIFFAPQRKAGVKSPTLKQLFDEPVKDASGSIVRDASPASRILFPAAVIEYVESKLERDLTSGPNAFDSMIAVQQNINGAKFEQPIVNFTGYGGPESARARRIAQLDKPSMMVSITASDITRTLPTSAIGLEMSKEAQAAYTLDFIGMTLARYFAVERYNIMKEALLAILQGDADGTNSSIATVQSALAQTKADTLDALVTVAGTLTHKAWIKWLFRNIKYRRIDTIVTDIDGLLAIENRTGRPTNVQDNSKDRIDRPFTVSYPGFEDQPVRVFVLETADGWPANTIMGFDSRSAIMKVTNMLADYVAVEEFVLQKKTAMRFDSGVLYSRLYDEAFDTLSLTLT